MSELEQQTSQPDPIASLHRMSTTAGVGAQDYVAINNLSIVAAVLGLTTALAFMGVLFLVVAAVAVLFGFIALRQIRNSNGTQAGQAFAWLGIVLALGISAIVLTNYYRQLQPERVESRQVDLAINQMTKLILAGDYPAAYKLLDDEFRKRWTLEQFQIVFKRLQDPEIGRGPIKKMYGNGLVQFSVLGDGSRYASTMIFIEFEKFPDRITTILKKASDNQWHISRLVEPFEESRAAPPPRKQPR